MSLFWTSYWPRGLPSRPSGPDSSEKMSAGVSLSRVSQRNKIHNAGNVAEISDPIRRSARKKSKIKKEWAGGNAGNNKLQERSGSSSLVGGQSRIRGKQSGVQKRYAAVRVELSGVEESATGRLRRTVRGRRRFPLANRSVWTSCVFRSFCPVSRRRKREPGGT